MSTTGEMKKGTLFLVPTPIGNKADFTFRAIDTLKASTLILAEDTRHSGPLLREYGVQTKILPYHDFNKEKVTAQYIEHLKQGEIISLITDAGMPGISDPAFFIVREAKKIGLLVQALPGPTAFVTALVASGLPPYPNCFLGFVPPKKSRWPHWLDSTKTMTENSPQKLLTFSMYISPYKLGPEFEVTLARELTKLFEEVTTQPVAKWVEYYQQKTPKGEYVLLYHLTFK
jgi:16S rRNA (cytidine1402-2'-O)-methyltransferase